jgi:catechol 2,3-dioxygenase-like lactoylglutathione lyase family enzyme
MMEQQLNLITLAVADLARARHFYETGLGWKPVQAEETIVFYQLGGLLLSLHPRELLREDAKQGPGWGQGGFTLAQNCAERATVDAIIARAVAAGATLQKAAVDTDWGGYSGYVADPDGHLWEIAWPVLEIMK